MSSEVEIKLSPNSLLFVDNISKAEPFSYQKIQTVAFSSPDSNRYREFRKCQDFIEFVLNPPLIEVIKRIYDRLLYDQSIYKNSGMFRSETYVVPSYSVVDENVNIID